MSPPRSVAQFLEDQHELLGLRLAGLERAVQAGAFDDARGRVTGFGAHLDRYARTEELLLFPVYDQLIAPLSEPTVRMRREHARLRRLVGRLARLIGGKDTRGALIALDTLRSMLLLHGTKEAWVIYPQIADALSPCMADALMRGLRSGIPLAS